MSDTSGSIGSGVAVADQRTETRGTQMKENLYPTLAILLGVGLIAGAMSESVVPLIVIGGVMYSIYHVATGLGS